MIPSYERVDSWRKELRGVESQLNLVNHDMQTASEGMTPDEIASEGTYEVYRSMNQTLDNIVSALEHLSDSVRYTGALAFKIEQMSRGTS